MLTIYIDTHTDTLSPSVLVFEIFLELNLLCTVTCGDEHFILFLASSGRVNVLTPLTYINKVSLLYMKVIPMDSQVHV